MNNEIESINAQLPRLRTLWTELAAKGKHVEAASVENEMAALEKALARYEVQHQAGQAEAARARAVEAAKATLAQIETHTAARSELESVVAEIEAAAKAVDAAMSRLDPAWSRCVATYPRSVTFKDPAQQSAYDDAMEGNRYPNFAPLRLRLRLPLVLDIFRGRGNAGLNHILSVADTRF